MTPRAGSTETVGYGARPVPVDLTRGRTLTEPVSEPVSKPIPLTAPSPSRDRNAYDRLSLKHWPRGHRVLVCSLAGGAGRTTMAAQLAGLLAGLPFAHIWPPALLVDASSRRAAPSRARTDASVTDECGEETGTPIGSTFLLGTTLSEARLLHRRRPGRLAQPAQLRAAVRAVQNDFAPVIIDAPCGLPSDSPCTLCAPVGFSVVLLVRPDEHSLTEAADALVWMHDRHLVDKQQVIVVINHGAGIPTRRTRLAAAALAVRCSGLHHLPAHPRLGPGPLAPVDRPVPTRLELPLAQIGLNIWHTSQVTTRTRSVRSTAATRQETA